MENEAYFFDFIIIGAGISGLAAAYELQKKGKKVLVLEKNDFVGGRMSAKTIDGVSLSLGTQFITPFYKNMNSLIDELHLKTRKLQIGKLAIKKKDNYYNFDAENPFSLFTFKGLSLKNRLRLISGLFLKLIEARKIDLYDLKTWISFDNKNIYEDLVEIVRNESIDYFIDPMLEAIFGYSSPKISKALFLATLTKLFNSKLYSFNQGINELCLVLATDLNLKTKIEVTSVIRQKEKVVLKTKSESLRNLILESNKVIFAIPGNTVLNIFANPTLKEKNFLQQVKYSTLGYVYFKSKETKFEGINTVWLPFKENNYFASFGLIKEKGDFNYYSAELRKNAINELAKNKDPNSYFKQLIRYQLNFDKFEIIHTQIWHSAVPIFSEGYITQLYNFQKTFKKSNQIFFCGDYLENPSTEGALTSGMKIVKLF